VVSVSLENCLCFVNPAADFCYQFQNAGRLWRTFALFIILLYTGNAASIPVAHNHFVSFICHILVWQFLQLFSKMFDKY